VADLKQWIAEHPDDFFVQQPEAPLADNIDGHSVKQPSEAGTDHSERELGLDADGGGGDVVTEPRAGLQLDQGPKPQAFSLFHPLVVYALIATNLATAWLWLKAR
jgi:hypothetical protein